MFNNSYTTRQIRKLLIKVAKAESIEIKESGVEAHKFHIKQRCFKFKIIKLFQNFIALTIFIYICTLPKVIQDT